LFRYPKKDLTKEKRERGRKGQLSSCERGKTARLRAEEKIYSLQKKEGERVKGLVRESAPGGRGDETFLGEKRKKGTEGTGDEKEDRPSLEKKKKQRNPSMEKGDKKSPVGSREGGKRRRRGGPLAKGGETLCPSREKKWITWERVTNKKRKRPRKPWGRGERPPPGERKKKVGASPALGKRGLPSQRMGGKQFSGIT